MKYAKEFPTTEALQEYLKAHPKADPRNHRVKGGPVKDHPGTKTDKDTRHYESMGKAMKRPDFAKARRAAGSAFAKSEAAKRSNDPAAHEDAAKAHEDAADQLEAAGDPDGAKEHRGHAAKHRGKKTARYDYR